MRKGKKILPKDVLPFVGDNPKDFDGDVIQMSSMRYKVFKESLVCCNCGAVGSRFYKEKTEVTNRRFHLNLYAVVDGKEVLMTKDHIIPKSKGGPDTLDNLQTMCIICNEAKADKI